jgi:hypothetical protein
VSAAPAFTARTPGGLLTQKLSEYARRHVAQLIEVEPHLDVDALDAYQSGRLNRDEEEAVRVHVVLCSSCRELLSSYFEFLEEAPEESRVGLAELMAALEELREARGSAS